VVEMKVGVSGAGNHRRKNRKRFGWNLRRQQCQISKLSKCRQQFLSTWNYYQQGCLGVVKKKDGWMIGQWRYNDKQSGPHTTKIVHGLMRYWTGKKIIFTPLFASNEKCGFDYDLELDVFPASP